MLVDGDEEGDGIDAVTDTTKGERKANTNAVDNSTSEETDYGESRVERGVLCDQGEHRVSWLEPTSPRHVRGLHVACGISYIITDCLPCYQPECCRFGHHRPDHSAR